MKNETLRKGLIARSHRAALALKEEDEKRTAAHKKADENYTKNTEAHALELKVIGAMLAELDKLSEIPEEKPAFLHNMEKKHG